MNTEIPIFVPEIDQSVAKLLHIDFHLCSGGDLNPILGFCFPLFSMAFPWGISTSVEICGK
jgi:hypothetical protein